MDPALESAVAVDGDRDLVLPSGVKDAPYI
jgi:hypothetical protein